MRRAVTILLALSAVSFMVAVPLSHVARTIQLPCRMGPCDAGLSAPYANLATGLNILGVFALLAVFVLGVIALIVLARSWDATA